jgi:hypothetical protein
MGAQASLPAVAGSLESRPPRPKPITTPSIMTSTVQKRAEALDPDTFFGVPIPGFDRAGRAQLILLLMAGLQPASKVLDLGCGVLRAGYWIVHFLEPGCYHGIEPHDGRLRTGLDRILTSDTVSAKRPRLATNAEFDTSVFGEKFDFFVAYSIWTHASKRQIETMLDGFVRDSTDEGVFLASVLPARAWQRDYGGERWFGTSHESSIPGCIRHRLSWIRRACRHRNLFLKSLGRELDGQLWLHISRQRRRGLLFTSIWRRSLWRRLAQRMARRLGMPQPGDR